MFVCDTFFLSQEAFTSGISLYIIIRYDKTPNKIVLFLKYDKQRILSQTMCRVIRANKGHFSQANFDVSNLQLNSDPLFTQLAIVHGHVNDTHTIYKYKTNSS